MAEETINPGNALVSGVSEEIMRFADERPGEGDPVARGLPAWLILIADDDEEVHRATTFALRDVLIDGRPLELLHAHSAAEAELLLRRHPEVAVAMLDVVMETPDAGLRLVEVIRRQIGLRTLRIVLRTGQPGYAPELDVIQAYDINDYRTKSELTQTRLITTLTSAARAYHQLEQIQATNRGMDVVARASNSLFRLHTLQLLAKGVFERMSEVMGQEIPGVLCVERDDSDSSSDTGLRIFHGTALYASLAGSPVDKSLGIDMQRSIKRCMAARTHIFEHDRFLLWLGASKTDAVACFDLQTPLSDHVQRLLEMFAASLSVGFENVDLIERLDFFAHFDPLTHLPNRTKFLDDVTEELFGHHDQLRGLALADIVRFSEVNDALGYRCGDSLLVLVGKRLRSVLPASVRLARISADTFGLFGLLESIDPRMIHHAFEPPFFVHGHALLVQVRIGIVSVSEAKGNAMELLRNAGLALNKARSSSGSATARFSAELSEDAQSRINTLHSLRAAIDFRRGLSLNFQPILDPKRNAIVGIEALLRWRNEAGQMVAPAQFIPLAERTGMMLDLGQWVLDAALSRFSVLQSLGYRDFYLAINLSSVQFRDERLLDRVRRSLEDNDISPRSLVVELTESICGEERKMVLRHLQRLRQLGVRVAIDDFGSGSFSLRQLMDLPVDILKIDRCFIEKIDGPGADIGMVEAIAVLARSSGMSTVAEGVETPGQLQALMDSGCDAMQGFHLCRPLTAEQLDGWLRSRQPLNTH